MEEEHDRKLVETQDLAPPSIVVKLSSTTLQVMGDLVAQIILMVVPSVEHHLNEIIIKQLSRIQEKVLHELNARHLGMLEEDQ